MTGAAWVALAIGVFTALMATGGIVWKLASMLTEIQTDVRTIMNNHLPHIYDVLKKLSEK